MKDIPKGMIPDKDNLVYFDFDNSLYYVIKWEDTGNSYRPIRIYLPPTHLISRKK